VTTATRRWFVRLAAALAFWPASAEAQTTARSFEELTRIVRPEEAVIVTDMTGRRNKGTIAAIDGDSLSLATDGRTQIFARSEVSAVRVLDGLGNGALIGAGIGLGSALGILGVAGSKHGYVLPSAKVGAPLLLSGVGALVGALVDRAREGGRVLYVSPGQTVALVVLPLIGKNSPGVLVSVGF